MSCRQVKACESPCSPCCKVGIPGPRGPPGRNGEVIELISTHIFEPVFTLEAGSFVAYTGEEDIDASIDILSPLLCQYTVKQTDSYPIVSLTVQGEFTVTADTPFVSIDIDDVLVLSFEAPQTLPIRHVSEEQVTVGSGVLVPTLPSSVYDRVLSVNTLAASGDTIYIESSAMYASWDDAIPSNRLTFSASATYSVELE